MTNQTSTQFATVNLSGDAADSIRDVMRQTGWNVEQSLAHLLTRVADRHTENNNLTEIGDMAIEGNTVGVQVVKNSVTAYEFGVGDLVEVTWDLDEGYGYDEGDVLKLYGVVSGFAPQGIEITLTDRSVEAAKNFDGVRVNKSDLWSVESVRAL